MEVDDYFSLAGMLKGRVLQHGIRFERKSSPYREDLAKRKAHASDSGLARRIWAQKKIAELELRPNKHEDEITELGKEHSIVTRNTSLIVLDRLEDYVTHRIIPPKPTANNTLPSSNNSKENDKSREKRLAGLIKKFEQELLGGTRLSSSVPANPNRVSTNFYKTAGIIFL